MGIIEKTILENQIEIMETLRALSLCGDRDLIKRIKETEKILDQFL